MLGEGDGLPKLVQAGLLHIQFETVAGEAVLTARDRSFGYAAYLDLLKVGTVMEG